MSRFLVFQVGCIECGVSSYPIKICDTIEEAEKIKADYPSTWVTEKGDGFIIIIDILNIEKPEHLKDQPHDE